MTQNSKTMNRPQPTYLAKLLLIGWLLLPAAAYADSARMEMLFERAYDFHQKGELDRALELYLQARSEEYHPLLTLNIAQIHRSLGQPEDALREMRHYIDTADANDPYLIAAQELIPLLEIQATQALNNRQIDAVEWQIRALIALAIFNSALLIVLLATRRR